MKHSYLITPLLLTAVGCASFEPPQQQQTPTYAPPVPIVSPQPPTPKPVPARAVTPGRTMRPTVRGAIATFDYEDGKVYPVVVSPGYLTAIHLEPGEQMPGNTALGDPDPTHWVVYKTAAGSSGRGARVIVLVQVKSAGLKTNLIIPTSRRTYQIDLISQGRRGMDMVQWLYPDEQIEDVKLPAPEPQIDPARLNHNYTIEAVNGSPPWVPLAAFDFGGPKAYVEFPSKLGSEIPAPPMFIVDSNARRPAPYRIRGNFYEVDTLFPRAQLQIGTDVVEISRR